MKIAKLLASFCCAMLLGACATIVEGSDQSITVSTNPTGASCELMRRGGTIGVVNPTPGTVQVDKSKRDITVRCDKEQYRTAETTVSSSFEGMTAGNILFGGLIGLAVDASSGAMHNYPTNVTLHLAPEQFQTETARDLYYRRRIETLREDADEAVDQVRAECVGDESQCDRAIHLIKEGRDEHIAELEAERASAPVEHE